MILSIIKNLCKKVYLHLRGGIKPSEICHISKSIAEQLDSMPIEQISKAKAPIIYPFVGRIRNHIPPSHPDEITRAWMGAIEEVRIKNAR